MVLSLFGAPRQRVRDIYGLTDRTDESYDTFFDHGLIFHYGLSNEVIGITATLLHGDVAFGGAILGVRLEDTLEKCIQQWGAPAYEEEPDEEWEYRKIAWKYQGYLLELEIWNSDGCEEGFGSWGKDTVKHIHVTLTWACPKCAFLNDWRTAWCKSCDFKKQR